MENSNLTEREVNAAKSFLLSPEGRYKVQQRLDGYFNLHLLPAVVQQLEELTGDKWQFSYWGSKSEYDESYEFTHDAYLSDPQNIIFHFLERVIGVVAFDIVNLTKGETVECFAHVASSIGVHLLPHLNQIEVSLPNIHHIYFSISPSDVIERFMSEVFFVGVYEYLKKIKNWNIRVSDSVVEQIAWIIKNAIDWEQASELRNWLSHLLDAVNKTAHSMVGQEYPVNTSTGKRYMLSVVSVERECETNISKNFVSFMPASDEDTFSVKSTSPLILKVKVADPESNETRVETVSLILTIIVKIRKIKEDWHDDIVISWKCLIDAAGGARGNITNLKLWGAKVESPNEEIILPDINSDAELKYAPLRLITFALSFLLER